VQGRGRAGGGRCKFTEEDDEKIIKWKKEGKSWNEVAKLFDGSTKQSLQVRYSTKFKATYRDSQARRQTSTG
jgi:hypothetical protein